MSIGKRPAGGATGAATVGAAGGGVAVIDGGADGKTGAGLTTEAAMAIAGKLDTGTGRGGLSAICGGRGRSPDLG